MFFETDSMLLRTFELSLRSNSLNIFSDIMSFSCLLAFGYCAEICWFTLSLSLDITNKAAFSEESSGVKEVRG